jgi:hypothetical protein
MKADAPIIELEWDTLPHGNLTLDVKVIEGAVIFRHAGADLRYNAGAELTYPAPRPEVPTTVPDSHVIHRWTKWKVVPSLFGPTVQRRLCVDCDLMQQTALSTVRP